MVKKKLHYAIYPVFTTAEDFMDYVFRVVWYLHPYIDEGADFTFFLSCPVPELLIPAHFAPEIALYADKVLKRSRFIHIDETGNAEQQPDTAINTASFDAIFCWKHTELQRLNAKITINMDKNTFGGNWDILYYYQTAFPHKLNSAIEKSKLFLESISKNSTHKKAYIFGTGPSLSDVISRDFSDGIRIACNSIVADDNIMEALKPHIIVCADAIFHSGCSEYASSFRKNLEKAIANHGCAVFTATRDYYIYVNTFDPSTADKVFTIPHHSEGDLNFSLNEKFSLLATNNIMTNFMLPLAAYLARHIVIVGADGRSLNDDTYYWQHNNLAQFHNKIYSARVVHPGFFSSVCYNNYYLKHCWNMERFLAIITRSGKIIENVTPTYIPALQKHSSEHVVPKDEKEYIVINDALSRLVKDKEWTKYAYDLNNEYEERIVQEATHAIM